MEGIVVRAAPDVALDTGTWNGPAEDIVIRLEGHEDSVTSVAFHPCGTYLASGSFDRNVLLWQLDATETPAILSYKGHGSAVTSVCFLGGDGEKLATSCADKFGYVFDTATAECVQQLKGHTSHVTSIDAGSGEGYNGNADVLLTCSNDSTARLWDVRERGQGRSRAEQLRLGHDFQVLCGRFGRGLSGGTATIPPTVYTGGLDGMLRSWDLRKSETPLLCMGRHGEKDVKNAERITGVSVSPDGSHVATFEADGAACVWDVRPFVGGLVGGHGNRLVASRIGTPHGIDANLIRGGWDRAGEIVVVGDADGRVMAWEYDDDESGGDGGDGMQKMVDGEEDESAAVMLLRGHAGCVNEVRFSPSVDRLVASASSDKTVLVGYVPR